MRGVICFIASLACALPGVTLALEPPKGEVLLTVSGAIGVTNVGDTAQFDLAMLQSLPETTFSTSTIWTVGEQEFTGVSLVDLLDVLEVDGDRLEATAINDYVVTIPVSDAEIGGPIIAYHLFGSTMSVREKGPLWVVYPYDRSADYRTDVIYARSIWQLDRLTVVE